ncbi:MAG: UDP-N-acetylglucosamine 2-epimerase (non-hydrolyzing) [Desulfatibacillaceae bacterium]|nr:UDP-N-acetylglucosamine 2-epimerase (non-hydrolyzing) [Desulfatibacillaceae bacterium]
MKLLTIIGARPQFIKAAAVSRAIRQHNEDSGPLTKLDEVVVHTGQHYDRNMSAVFFEEMEIQEPDYSLDIHDSSHGAMTGRMLAKIEEVLLNEKPDTVLVYGDTNTTLAGALAAAKLHIPVAHVEAGLRSFNRKMPEEINRVMADHLASVLFCPTDAAVKNLAAEGISQGKPGVAVVRTGDVMLDAALYYSKKSAGRASLFAPESPWRKKLEDAKDRKGFALATVHRAENTDDPERLEGIFAALGQIASDMPVVLPLHPRTRKMLAAGNSKGLGNHTNLWMLEPVGYFDMLELLKNCCLVLTDSGGLQKEAFFFKKPCVTLRDETEWVELVENRANVLAGACARTIVEAANTMLKRKVDFDMPLYGSGQAGLLMAKTLSS